MWYARDADGSTSQGANQPSSNQQHTHQTIFSQSAHFVNGPFPATLQVWSTYWHVLLSYMINIEIFHWITLLHVIFYWYRNRCHQYHTMDLCSLKFSYLYTAWLHFSCNICIYINQSGGYRIPTMLMPW